MKFVANRKELLTQAETVLKAVPSLPTVEILKGLLVEADDRSNTITLTGTNYEVAIQCRMSTYVEAGGSMVIDAKYFTNMLALFTEDDVTVELGRNNVCTISSGTPYYNLAVQPAKEYPKPDIPFPDGAVKVSNLRTLAKSTVFAASKSEASPIMMGIRLEINGNRVRACGSDGARLMERVQDIEAGGTLSLIIPARSFNMLSSLVTDKDTLEVGIVGPKAVFMKEGFLFSTNLIIGDYIDVDRMMSSVKPEYIAIADAKELYKALDTVNVMSGDTGRVSLSFRNDTIQIALASDAGKSQTAVQAVVMQETPANGFYFNTGYLYEALRRLSGHVEIQLSSIGMLSIKSKNDLYFQLPLKAPEVTVKKAKAPKTKAA